MIKLGSTDIGKLYLGSTEISKAYLGSSLVYDNSGGGGTPTSYDAQVEYLQASGTQYIDTGIVCNLQTKIEVSFNASAESCLLGYRDSASVVISFAVSSRTDYIRFGEAYKQKALSYGTDYTAVIDNTGLTINGTKETWLPSSFTTSGTLQLFAIGNTTWQKFKGKMYYCKVWDDGTLVRDFIPVRVGATGYMYDRVSHQLFGNAGNSGSFVLGNDILYPNKAWNSSNGGENQPAPIDEDGYCVTPFYALSVNGNSRNVTVKAGYTKSSYSGGCFVFKTNLSDANTYTAYLQSQDPRTLSVNSNLYNYISATFKMSEIDDCYILDNISGEYLFKGKNVT